MPDTTNNKPDETVDDKPVEPPAPPPSGEQYECWDKYYQGKC